MNLLRGIRGEGSVFPPSGRKASGSFCSRYDSRTLQHGTSLSLSRRIFRKIVSLRSPPHYHSGQSPLKRTPREVSAEAVIRNRNRTRSRNHNPAVERSSIWEWRGSASDRATTLPVARREDRSRQPPRTHPLPSGLETSDCRRFPDDCSPVSRT